jgi:hypothetical protein
MERSGGAAAPAANGFDRLAHGTAGGCHDGQRSLAQRISLKRKVQRGCGGAARRDKEIPKFESESRRQSYSIRSCKWGAVDIDHISQRQRRRRPPPRPADRASHRHREQKIGNAATPAGRTAPCSPSEPPATASDEPNLLKRNGRGQSQKFIVENRLGGSGKYGSSLRRGRYPSHRKKRV